MSDEKKISLPISLIEDLIEIKGSVKRLLGHSEEFKNDFKSLTKLIHQEVVDRQAGDASISKELENDFKGLYRSVAGIGLLWLFTVVCGVVGFIAYK